MDAIIKQNDSNVPNQILIAYDLANTRLSLCLFPPVRYDKEDKYARNQVSFAQIMGVVHNEVFVALSDSPLWPYVLPNPQAIVRKAQFAVEESSRNPVD